MNLYPASSTGFGRGRAARTVMTLSLVAGTVGFGGCVVTGVIEGVGKVAVATVSTAGNIVGAAVKATGHVAASSVDASGEVTDSSVKFAAKLSQQGMVVFFDPKSGAVWKTPWSEGLRLLTASQTAQIGATLQAARVIRGATVVATDKKTVADLLVKPGDVVELTHVPSVTKAEAIDAAKLPAALR